jgi:4-diphosphocytidyl-2-C-methyl-D-erythritol kinase
MSDLVVSAPAKVNLFLGVGALRPDGYHNVVTIMHALDLADTVRLTPADELTVTCDSDVGIPSVQNLAFRAAQAFSEAYGVDVLVDIAIEKRIPAGAGLGGGSSDAAAVLAGLAHWAGVPNDHAPLMRIARSLGADCAFLLQDGPALMRGRGDELARSLPAVAAHVTLVKPHASVPTTDAYRVFEESPQLAGAVSGMADALRWRDISAVASALRNNMTDAAEALVPEIAEVRAWLGNQDGVLGVLMAGSGSAVFALCQDAPSAEQATAAAREHGWWSAATRARASGVTVVEGEVVA